MSCLVSREEEGVPLCVLALHPGKVPVRRILRPRARREDVFVAFVPPSIHHLGQRRVVPKPLELLVRCARLFVLLLARLQQWVVRGRIDVGLFVGLRRRSGSGLGRLCRVVKEGSVKAGNPVEQEVVDFVMLPLVSVIEYGHRHMTNLRAV